MIIIALEQDYWNDKEANKLKWPYQKRKHRNDESKENKLEAENMKPLMYASNFLLLLTSIAGC